MKFWKLQTEIFIPCRVSQVKILKSIKGDFVIKQKKNRQEITGVIYSCLFYA